MRNPPGSVGNGTINRGNRWQGAEIINGKSLFTSGFAPNRYTDDTSMLTGFAWEYAFALDFPCMTCTAGPEFPRWRRVFLRVVSPDMAS